MEAPFEQWSKNANSAASVDRWLLNQFPRPDGKPFVFNGGGYHTLNFIPALATMILGLMAGQLLMSRRDDRQKLGWLVAGGFLCMLLGFLSGMFACPVVKRIWTPSWTLYSGAWVLWILALFYLVFDVGRLKRLAFPLVVVGMNPLMMYMMGQLLRGWLVRMLTIHGGQVTSGVAGGLGMSEAARSNYAPLCQYTAAFIVMWLICYGMYRRKAFLRI
jgi:predicted acyltransferase